MLQIMQDSKTNHIPKKTEIQKRKEQKRNEIAVSQMRPL